MWYRLKNQINKFRKKKSIIESFQLGHLKIDFMRQLYGQGNEHEIETVMNKILHKFMHTFWWIFRWQNSSSPDSYKSECSKFRRGN